MWNVAPDRWFSWDFTVRDSSHQPVAAIKLSGWRERGAVIVAGTEHRVSRQGLLGPFVLESGGSVVASADKAGASGRGFGIQHHGRHYMLRRRSFWRRAMVLQEGDRELGSVAPDAWSGRHARVDLPDDLPVTLRLFVVWLALLLWKRDGDVAATG